MYTYYLIEMSSHKNVWKDPYGLFSAVQLDYCLCLALDRLQESDQRERYFCKNTRRNISQKLKAQYVTCEIDCFKEFLNQSIQGV